jgi:hypothetical protein
MSPRDRADAVRITAYEIALWIFGAAAIAGAAWGAQWANRTLSLANGGYYCDAEGNCTERYDFVLTQTVLSLAPAVLVAGLVALIAALAIRAAAVILRRWDTAAAVSASASAPASEPVATAVVDRFMRPPPR